MLANRTVVEERMMNLAGAEMEYLESINDLVNSLVYVDIKKNSTSNQSAQIHERTNVVWRMGILGSSREWETRRLADQGTGRLGDLDQ